MDDSNAWDSVSEASPLHPFKEEILMTNILPESNLLLMTNNSSTNPPFTTPSNDSDRFLPAAEDVTQRRTAINEDNRSQSSKSIDNIQHHRSTQPSMNKNNKQTSM
jgi:hypothetical protein